MSSARSIIKDENFSSNRIFGNELKYLKEVLETDFRTSAYGMMTDRLEKAFAKKIGVKFAVGHNSGTGPLHSMLESIGIEPGDEVIVTPLTMSAPTYAIIAAGGTPVYADIDPESFNISPESIEKLITSYWVFYLFTLFYPRSFSEFTDVAYLINGSVSTSYFRLLLVY